MSHTYNLPCANPSLIEVQDESLQTLGKLGPTKHLQEFQSVPNMLLKISSIIDDTTSKKLHSTTLGQNPMLIWIYRFPYYFLFTPILYEQLWIKDSIIHLILKSKSNKRKGHSFPIILQILGSKNGINEMSLVLWNIMISIEAA